MIISIIEYWVMTKAEIMLNAYSIKYLIECPILAESRHSAYRFQFI